MTQLNDHETWTFINNALFEAGRAFGDMLTMLTDKKSRAMREVRENEQANKVLTELKSHLFKTWRKHDVIFESETWREEAAYKLKALHKELTILPESTADYYIDHLIKEMKRLSYASWNTYRYLHSKAARIRAQYRRAYRIAKRNGIFVEEENQ